MSTRRTAQTGVYPGAIVVGEGGDWEQAVIPPLTPSEMVCVGSGLYGHVYKCYCVIPGRGNTNYCVKILKHYIGEPSTATTFLEPVLGEAKPVAMQAMTREVDMWERVLECPELNATHAVAQPTQQCSQAKYMAMQFAQAEWMSKPGFRHILPFYYADLNSLYMVCMHCSQLNYMYL